MMRARRSGGDLAFNNCASFQKNKDTSRYKPGKLVLFEQTFLFAAE